MNSELAIGTLVKQLIFNSSSLGDVERYGLIVPTDPFLSNNIPNSDQFVSVLWQPCKENGVKRGIPELIQTSKLSIVSKG